MYFFYFTDVKFGAGFYYFTSIITYFDLTWFLQIENCTVVSDFHTLKTMALPPCRLQLKVYSLLKRSTPGIIDEAGHHVRPAGVCEEGTGAQG